MSTDKPHKGTIINWRKIPFSPPKGLGYLIFGMTNDLWALRTSYVVAHDEATGEIETRNSRYTLVGPEAT